MIKKLIPIILIFACLSNVAACSGPSSDSGSGAKAEQTVLTMWTFSMNNELPVNAAFMEANPDVRIETLQVPWAEYEKKLFAALTTGQDVPDIVIAESYWWGKWQHMPGIFENLEPYGISQETMAPEVAGSARNINGELTIAPLAIGIGCIWYRKDLARRYLGTDDPEQIEKLLPDWEAVEALGARMKAESNGQHYLFPETASLAEFLIAANKNYLDNNVLKLQDHILPLFEQIEHWRDSGYIANLKGMALDQSYVEGNVLFYPYADWHGVNIMERDPGGADEWHVIQPPGGVFYRGGYGYAIPIKSSPENKEAAARRIAYILSPEGARKVMETSQISAFKHISEDDLAVDATGYFSPDLPRTFLAWSEQIKQPIVYNPYNDVIEKELRIQAYNMMVYPISAREAIEAAKKTIEADIGSALRIE